MTFLLVKERCHYLTALNNGHRSATSLVKLNIATCTCKPENHFHQYTCISLCSVPDFTYILGWKIWNSHLILSFHHTQTTILPGQHHLIMNKTFCCCYPTILSIHLTQEEIQNKIYEPYKKNICIELSFCSYLLFLISKRNSLTAI